MTAASFRTVVSEGDAALDKRLSDELDVVNAAATMTPRSQLFSLVGGVSRHN